MKKSSNKEKDEAHIVPFRGAKLNKREANQTGFAVVAGIVGIILALIIFGKDNKLYSLILVGLFSGLGFFGYGFLSKNNKRDKT